MWLLFDRAQWYEGVDRHQWFVLSVVRLENPAVRTFAEDFMSGTQKFCRKRAPRYS